MKKLTKIELNFDGHDLKNIFLVNTDFNSRGFIVSSPLFEEGQELRLYGQKLNEETSYYNAVLISGNENNILIPNEVLIDDDNSFYIRLKFELLGTNKKLSTETVILSVNSTFQGSKIESDLSELYYELSVKDKMIDDFRLELAGIQENELDREEAESVRVANEAERISRDSERDSKIDSKADVSELELYAKKGELSELQAYVGYTDHDIVGIEADLENKRVTRVAGAVNRTAGASFDNIRAFGGRRRCTVADDGEVLGYYGETGYDETGETGQVMVEQPKFYYKVVPLKLDKIEDGKGFHMRKARYYVSDSPKEGFKIHPAFVDENGKVRQYIYLSAFEGSIFDVSNDTYLKNDEQIADFDEDMFSSIPGAKPASGLTQSLTRGNTRKLAQNRGDGWEQSYSATASLTQLLFAIEYASFNTQEELGYGVLGKPSGEGNESELTGATTSLGNESGYVERNGFEVPTYRGEENFYGNIWKWVDGLNYQGDEGRRNLYVATHGFADNTDAEPFKDIGFTLPGGLGYVSAFGYGNEDMDWLFFGSEYSGNSSVPVGDHNYSNNTGWRVALLGGGWYNSAAAGGFCWYFDYAGSYSHRTFGCRLVYAPTVEEVV